MTTTYRTKLLRSVLDCGCNLNLGEFAEEAQLADVEEWARERGFVLILQSPAKSSELDRHEAARIP